MRIGDRTFYMQFADGLAQSRDVQARALAQLADGKRVRVASDDPAAAHASMGLRARLAALGGYDRSAQAAQADLQTVDAAFDEIISVLTSAQTEAMGAASGVFADGNDAVADKVDSLREQLLALANTRQNGRYLFAGTETLNAAFAADGTYQGDSAEVQAPIDAGETVGATIDGSSVFINGGDLFARLEQLSTALRSDDTAGIQAASTALAGDLDRVIAQRGAIGARLERLDAALVRHGDESVRLLQRVSELEDADFTRVIVELQSAETQWTALSAAAAKVLGRSLFDILG